VETHLQTLLERRNHPQAASLAPATVTLATT
jgi:hypothetical protein